MFIILRNLLVPVSVQLIEKGIDSQLLFLDDSKQSSEQLSLELFSHFGSLRENVLELLDAHLLLLTAVPGYSD